MTTQFTDPETDRLHALVSPPLLLHDKAEIVERPALAPLPELDHKQFYRLIDASDNTDKIPTEIVAEAKVCQELRIAAIDARGAYLELDAVNAATLHGLDYEAKVEGHPATACSDWSEKLTKAHATAVEVIETYALRVERFVRRLSRDDDSAYLPMIHAALGEPIVKAGAALAAGGRERAGEERDRADGAGVRQAAR